MAFVGKSSCHDCRVLEISRDGAKLSADIVAPIGARLYLSATPSGPNRKECEVVWQKNRILGVRFV
jgi:PilZ domain-containing protein